MAQQTQLTFDWTGTSSDSAPSPFEDLSPPAQEPKPLRSVEVEEGEESAVDDPMPWQAPLPEAIERGAFGTEDDNVPVHPSGEEVQEITAQFAERLMDLLSEKDAAQTRLRHASDMERTTMLREYENRSCAMMSALALYAEDFGSEATTRLEAWARREMVRQSEDDPATARAPASSSAQPSQNLICVRSEPPWDFSTSFPAPMQEAIVHGVISEESTNPEGVAAIHDEHLKECLSILHDLDAIEAAKLSGVDPRTGRKPRTVATRKALQQHLASAPAALQQSFEDLIAVYRDGFGDTAAEAFRARVQSLHRKQTAPVTQLPAQQAFYDEGHPWHYLKRGDAATPITAESIRPGSRDFLEEMELPKNPAKRAAKIEQMLADQKRQLVADKGRYKELVDQGPKALSDYDRNIAHGGDEEMAWASSVALKFNHIRNDLARIAGLEKLQGEKGKPG